MREMKDSGVEWIGKIPKDWEIVPLTKQLDSIVDYRGKTPEKEVIWMPRRRFILEESRRIFWKHW